MEKLNGVVRRVEVTLGDHSPHEYQLFFSELSLKHRLFHGLLNFLPQTVKSRKYLQKIVAIPWSGFQRILHNLSLKPLSGHIFSLILQVSCIMAIQVTYQFFNYSNNFISPCLLSPVFPKLKKIFYILKLFLSPH